MKTKSKEENVSELLGELRKKQAKEKFNENPLVQIVKGLWTFAEGSALLVTSLYSIYQGRYGTQPTWGKDVLIVSGVLVLVPAAILLSKFFRQVGKA